MKLNTKTITEGAFMLGLGIILSFITPFQKILPFGGSITLASMLPISIFSIRHGIKKGLFVSSLFAIFHLATGIIKDGLFAWGLTAEMLIACILFDYIIAYSVIGFAGIFRKYGKTGWIAGIAIALLLRFISHFISGIVVFMSIGKIWDSIDFIADNKYIYSLVYNGAYMLPELLITILMAWLIFSSTPIKKWINSNSSII